MVIHDALVSRDAPLAIEDIVNSSFHLFRDLVILVAGDERRYEARDSFFRQVETVYDLAREIVKLQERGDYASAHVKASQEFHFPLFEAIHSYDPDISRPVVWVIDERLGKNWGLITARAGAKKWDLNKIKTNSSLDIVAEGIQSSKTGEYSAFFAKYENLLTDYRVGDS